MSQDGGAKEGISRRGFVKGALALGAAGVAVAGGAASIQTLAGDSPPVAHETHETFLYLNPEGAPLPVWWVERGLVGKKARLGHFQVRQGAPRNSDRGGSGARRYLGAKPT